MVVAEYEALRAAVLGAALPPEARPGLLLFLRRGMCGWARAVATMGAPRPTGSQPPIWKIPEEHRAIVHILAAMVIINANHYGAAP